MSTDLVHIQNPTEAAVAKYEGVGFGGKMFELKPYILDLVQKQKKRANGDKINPGVLAERTGEGVYEEMHIVLLSEPTESRVLFPPGADLGAYPLCRSRDGVKPVEDDDRLEPQAVNCKNCEFSSWKKWQKTKKKEDLPPCKEKVSLRFVDRQGQWPYILALGGKNLSSKVKGVMTLPLAMQEVARQMMKVYQKTGKKLNLFDFSMKVAPVEITSGGYTSYVLGFTNIAPIKEEDRHLFGEAYEKYVAARQNFDEAEDENASVDEELSERSTTQQSDSDDQGI